MKLQDLKRKIGGFFTNNWMGIWLIMLTFTYICLTNLTLELTPWKSMHTVYVGQEMRIYKQDEIFIPVSFKIRDKTDEYVSIIATEKGEYDINRNLARFCTVNVKEGNEYDSYVVLTNNGNINTFKLYAIYLVLFGIVLSIFICIFKIICNKEESIEYKEMNQDYPRNDKKNQKNIYKTVVKKEDLKFD